MPTLAEKLLNEETRPRVIADCVAIIEAEVASKRGMSGFAVKTAFATIKAFKKTIVKDSVEGLIDDFVAKLEPYYQRHIEEGGEIKAFVGREADPIADSLLEITDERAKRSSHTTLVKVYTKLRPQGKQQVIQAMPRVGDMLASHGV
jgi:hypothetical protein